MNYIYTLTERDKVCLRDIGFFHIHAYYTEDEVERLHREIIRLVERTYTVDNLREQRIYPRIGNITAHHGGCNRVSHSMMISEGPSDLPRVDHRDLRQLSSLLSDHNRIISELTGKSVKLNTRCLLNHQCYLSGNKPLPSHFDAISIDPDAHSNSLAIMPRFVAVLTIRNGSSCAGIELIDGTRAHSPRLETGDLLVFDNIKLRHRVPTLTEPRVSVGLRNYDHLPVHFVANEQDQIKGAVYRRISEGYISEQVDCLAQFRMHLLYNLARSNDL